MFNSQLSYEKYVIYIYIYIKKDKYIAINFKKLKEEMSVQKEVMDRVLSSIGTLFNFVSQERNFKSLLVINWNTSFYCPHKSQSITLIKYFMLALLWLLYHRHVKCFAHTKKYWKIVLRMMKRMMKHVLKYIYLVDIKHVMLLRILTKY